MIAAWIWITDEYDGGTFLAYGMSKLIKAINPRVCMLSIL
jgi:hypothetical protein